ncbi:hypothetical protein B0H11DRAFT_2113107, partial [Mycena galericulata]
DGTLYNVNRQLLVLKSDCFAGMLTLPAPVELPSGLSQSSKDLIELSRKARLDGTSDATAVHLPQSFSGAECEAFLEFIFNLLPWTSDTPPLERLCALLKTCDFFGAESGVRYATHHLEDHPDLGPALRYRLASDYHIDQWAKQAFYELMSGSILEISVTDEKLLGWSAYRTLVRTHAKVAQYRLGLAFFPPMQIYSWAKNWVGISGGLGTLLKDEISGSDLHDALHEMVVPGMNEECRVLTVTSIQDTPDGKSLLKEEEYIDNAVEALIKQW